MGTAILILLAQSMVSCAISPIQRVATSLLRPDTPILLLAAMLALSAQIVWRRRLSMANARSSAI